MADAKQAWEQVVEGFTELGRALRERVAEATGGTSDSSRSEEPAASAWADAAEEKPSSTGTESGSADDGSERDDSRTVADALNAFAEAARRLGETAGAAVTDPTLRDSAVRVADRLGTALAATVDEIGENLKTFADSRRNQRSQSSEGPWAEAADAESSAGGAAEGTAASEAAAADADAEAADADAETAPTLSDDDPRAGGA